MSPETEGFDTAALQDASMLLAEPTRKWPLSVSRILRLLHCVWSWS
jgi:hypothetical protein